MNYSGCADSEDKDQPHAADTIDHCHNGMPAS